MAGGIGALEGGTLAAIVRHAHRDALQSLELDVTVAVLTGAASTAHVASALWPLLSARLTNRVLVWVLLWLGVACTAGLALRPGDLMLSVAMGLLGRLAWSGLTTVRSALWRQDPSRAHRVRRAAWVMTASSVMTAVSGLGFGVLADTNPDAMRVAWIASAVVGALGAVLFVRGVPIPNVALAPAQAREGMVTILGRDTGFRAYERWSFVQTSATLMAFPILIVVLQDRLHAAHWLQILVITAIPIGLSPLTMGRWAARLTVQSVARFRVDHAVVHATAFGLFAAGAAIERVELLLLASVVLGIAFAGGSLAWHLGHQDYSGPDRALEYGAVHAMTTGVAGLIAPAVGAALGRHVGGEPGLALIVPVGLSLVALRGFRTLAR
jgi:hypothetical protein